MKWWDRMPWSSFSDEEAKWKGKIPLCFASTRTGACALEAQSLSHCITRTSPGSSLSSVLKVMTKLDSIFKSRDISLPTKVRLVKAMVFPVVMYGCESWTVKKAERWRIDAFELVLEKTLESPLHCKEIQPVHSEGDQPWDFFGRNDAKAETPVLWPT